jgi:glutathione synthase/RimK-type ligase-like ATP-grasp enzyme
MQMDPKSRPPTELDGLDLMILLWGLPGDAPMAQVYTVLKRLGQPVIFFDQRNVLQSELELRADTTIEGNLRIGGLSVELGSFTAVYMRLYGTHQLPGFRGVDQNSAALFHALAIVDALCAWVELTQILVVNRPSTMESNGSKPYQLRLIEEHGFRIPDTLITTDRDAAQEFWEKHGTVVYKSISGVRSIVTKLSPRHLERLDRVRWCPTQFQEYIPGKDYRVHVVDKEVFAAEITSSADDYRYARRLGTTAEVRPCVLPVDVATCCRSMSRALGLHVAGVDLRHHPSGQWYCFEVNPSPAFSYYQNETNQPIDLAIARLLISSKELA